MKNDKGFTLVELVVVILLLSVLSVVSFSLFLDGSTYRDRAAYDEVLNAVRYAQKLAVATGCEVQVKLTAAGYDLQQHANSCSAGNFVTISNQHPFNAANFPAVKIEPVTTFLFDAMGRSSAAVAVTVGTYKFSVVAETGYAREL